VTWRRRQTRQHRQNPSPRGTGLVVSTSRLALAASYVM